MRSRKLLICLDFADDELVQTPVTYVDGRHDANEKAPVITSFL